MKKVACGSCGLDLSAEVEADSCPSCGSEARAIYLAIDETVAVTESQSATRSRDGEVTGVWHADEVRASSATADGSLVKGQVSGEMSTGESDTPRASEVLRARFDIDHEGTWTTKVVAAVSSDPYPWVDSRLYCDGREAREVQVIRAKITNSLWTSLNHHRLAEVEESYESAAGDLRDAISKKAKYASDEDRKGMDLALDATRVLSHALPAVVRKFRDLHGGWAASLGFKAIWIVGPSVALTTRLD